VSDLAGERGERGEVPVAGPTALTNKKIIKLANQRTKLNSDCTIKFISINTLKQDVTWIYLDKVTSGLHSK
jgi:hypothetical protein